MHTSTYQSVAELADTAKKHVEDVYGDSGHWGTFVGAKNVTELMHLATYGLPDVEAEVMEIVESAIESVEKDHNFTGFQPYWDVSGAEVDVARYLSGEPECMIDYQLVETPRAGRVITLCASIAVSSAISQSTIRKRGHGVAALAFALTRLGFNVELWADYSTSFKNGRSTDARIRTLVKGANDDLDPARIMFAYTHPAMPRGLNIPAKKAWPGKLSRHISGIPMNPTEDMPDGTIYLPCVMSPHDVPNADVMLREHLAQLGIIREETTV
jgi:hypothetical protein